VPGIAGIIFQNGGIELSKSVQQMAKAIRREAWQTIQLEQSEFGAIASITIDQEKRIIQKNGIILAYAGEIVEQETLGVVTNQLNRTSKYGERVKENFGAPFYGLADGLLEIYRHRGAGPLCGLNGLYTIAIWDGPARTLSLINDRYGIQKLYVWQSGGNFVFSSEIKAIAQLPGFSRRLSSQGVVDLVSLGYILDERTLFEDIIILPPASFIRVQNGRVEYQTYWNFAFDSPEISRRKESQIVADLGCLAQQAVRRRMHPKSTLFLTGGLDSRLVAGMFKKNDPDYPADALSLGQPKAKDVIYGLQLANLLGFNFHHVLLDSSYIAAYSRECVVKTEGNMNIHASWILAANEIMRASGIQYALTGIGGEAAAGRHILLETMQRDPRRGLEMFFAREDITAVSRLLRKDIAAGLIAETKASFTRALQKAPSDNPLNKLDYIGYYQSLRRHATSVDVFADVAHPLDPLLDNDLIDYVQGIPPELRARGYLYRKMIQKFLPETVHIGEALRGPILKADMDRKWNEVQSFYRRIRRRVAWMGKRSGTPMADKPEGYIFPNTWLRTGSRGLMISTMKHAECLADLFDMDAVNGLVTDHLSGRKNHYSIICGLMTVILFHQEFVDRVSQPSFTAEEPGGGLPEKVAR
jgi:asparagine synthetase B (glutamine-hydrolysing)